MQYVYNGRCHCGASFVGPAGATVIPMTDTVNYLPMAELNWLGLIRCLLRRDDNAGTLGYLSVCLADFHDLNIIAFTHVWKIYSVYVRPYLVYCVHVAISHSQCDTHTHTHTHTVTHTRS